MPKQEVGSTKWLGNKMKAKGLQKLRWYCQMCQKQCRDENGFKCHRMSDGHQRQMQLFVQDPNRFMDEFSQEFEQGFMQLMSHSYRSTRVLANTVYCDFISNRHHTHMNSTIWVTLSNFVQYLGRTNQCKIDKTPKGWYLQWVDNSPEARLRAAKAAELERAEVTDAQRHTQLLKDQVESAAAEGGFQESEFTELQREEGDAPVSFAMGTSAPSGSAAAASSGASGAVKADVVSDKANVLEMAFEAHSTTAPVGSGSRASSRDAKEKAPKERKLSAMEAVRLEHEAAKRRKTEEQRPPSSPSSSVDGQEAWLAAGLVVKVMHQELSGGKFYRKKGKIEKVHDGYTADVRMIEPSALIRIEQEMLETVIPNVGKPVRVVKGTHKGQHATVRGVDLENFCVSITLSDGTEMEGMGYDEICKVEA
mmetsp:Transcript_25613/g.58206  ORF Transcript_25613/g.58206 Transcript_25613/m.58206 type:complete len:422 (+) Transcript_25613:67-1332(+)|eukprot:CAMPEP_0197904066 /NCGR_PEP_ID=MMETSP1439-20131203/57256_1 /TAXON_ID=66791 /ORGANISM="Gonyaulax spinifera, Strain CCMP409" /LENGTH=421 /DNA_ID=CAMNT_0043525229 /DNA_START=67 /DNA_END=1332 /DNA_ORIENTATION=-